MKLIKARFPDVCLACCNRVEVGDWVFWERKQTYHEECHPAANTIKGKLIRDSRRAVG